jgi:hypothetical protein
MGPRRKQGLACREISDGEIIVLSSDGSTAIVLNAMGAVVWDLLDGSRGVEELAALICATLPDGGLERVQADIAALLSRLRELGLLEEIEACGPLPSAL